MGVSLFALRKKDGVNLRVLIFVLYLRPSRLDVLIGLREIFDLVGETPRLQSEIADRFCGGIKMLMKPISRWHEQTIRTPIDSDARAPFLP